MVLTHYVYRGPTEVLKYTFQTRPPMCFSQGTWMTLLSRAPLGALSSHGSLSTPASVPFTPVLGQTSPFTPGQSEHQKEHQSVRQTLRQRQLILVHSFRDIRVRHHPCAEPRQQHRVPLLNHKQETEIKLAMAWVFQHLKPSSSDIVPLTRPNLSLPNSSQMPQTVRNISFKPPCLQIAC